MRLQASLVLSFACLTAAAVIATGDPLQANGAATPESLDNLIIVLNSSTAASDAGHAAWLCPEPLSVAQ